MAAANETNFSDTSALDSCPRESTTTVVNQQANFPIQWWVHVLPAIVWMVGLVHTCIVLIYFSHYGYPLVPKKVFWHDESWDEVSEWDIPTHTTIGAAVVSLLRCFWQS